MIPNNQSSDKGLTIIIGNGAIECKKQNFDSWMPVKDLRNFVNNKSNYFLKRSLIDELDPYLFLSILSTYENIFTNNFEDFLEQKDSLKQDQALSDLTDWLYYRHRLCESYQTILNELKLKPIPEVILKLVATYEQNITVMTTNWELTAESLLKKLGLKTDLHYINGNINKPNSLIFPTQTAFDHLKRDKLIQNIKSTHKSSDIMENRIKPYVKLQDSDHIIFWGMAFYPSENELAAMLINSHRPHNNSHKKITVINTNYNAVLRTFALTKTCNNRIFIDKTGIAFSTDSTF